MKKNWFQDVWERRPFKGFAFDINIFDSVVIWLKYWRYGVKHKLINQSIIEINIWLPSGIHFQSLQNSNSLVLLSSRRQWYWSGLPQDSRRCRLDGLASSRHLVFTTSLWDFTCWRTSVNRTKNRKITIIFWNRNTLNSNVN